MERIWNLNIEEIVTGIPGGFFIYRADGNEEIVYANDETIYLYGCETMEEFCALTGNSFRGMVHPDDLDGMEESIWEQIGKNNKKLDHVEYRIIKKDGEIRWVEDFGHLVKSSIFGDVFYVFISDVTEKREDDLKKEKKYVDRLSDHALISKALQSTLSAYRKIYFINLKEDYFRLIYPEKERASGVYSKEVVERILTGKIKGDNQEEIGKLLMPNAIRKALLHENSVEYQYGRIDGEGMEERSAALFTVSEREDGEPVYVVMGVRSIENVLQRDEKQKMILEHALLQAEQADEAKAVFLANMSHDMRTPMNAIVGFTDLAFKHIDDTEKMQDYLEKIKDASGILMELIDDILDMSRIESGRMKMKESYCSLPELIEDAMEPLKKQIMDKNLSYELDMKGVKNGCIFCDELRLVQVLVNVIGNAVKFTPPDGKISVSVTQTDSLGQRAAQYEFRIKDNGIGIAPEFLDKIFQPFEREKTSTVSKMKGTGLGLAITKKIVDLMNGTIEVHSRQGEGSEFIICLPFRIRTKKEPDSQTKGVKSVTAPERAEMKSLKGKRILLVEDNELNREIGKSLLEESGLIVEEAEDGDIALQMLKEAENPYDCIVMDIQMPRMNGYQATEAIRALKDPAHSRIPIIGLSANAFEEDKRKALLVGMDDYVAKPMDTNIVLKTIQKYILP